MDVFLRSRAERLANEIASQARTADDLNELMRSMMKSALERMLNTEMDFHLGRKGPAVVVGDEASPSGDSAPAEVATRETPPAKRAPNRRNGRSRKTVPGGLGELTIATPRDRNGTFEPQLIGKHQRRLPGFDEKILALYAKGMTTRDIQDVVQELYGVEISPTLISEITADVDAEATAWRSRPLDRQPGLRDLRRPRSRRTGTRLLGRTHASRPERRAARRRHDRFAEYVRDHGGSDAGWVSGMYHDLLGRAPDAQGLQYWTARLRSGESHYAVALGFAASAEREALAIDADYRAFLGRPADQAEVASWVAQFAAGVHRDALVAALIGSAESFNNPSKGDGSDAAWVESVYRNLFALSVPAGEEQYWVSQLELSTES